MIVERTVYDVRCSRCHRAIAFGHDNLKDAKRREKYSTVTVHGAKLVLCVSCETSAKEASKS